MKSARQLLPILTPHHSTLSSIPMAWWRSTWPAQITALADPCQSIFIRSPGSSADRHGRATLWSS